MTSLPRDPAAWGIQPARLHADVARLAALGRKLPGSPQEEAACGIITDALRDAGVAHEVHIFDAFIGWPERTAITVAGREIRATGVGSAAGTGPNGVTAPVAALDGGGDLAGRLVLTDGLPRYDACVRAMRAGALGVIAISTGPDRHYVQASPLWGPPASDADLALLPTVPAAQVSAEDGAYLRSLAGTATPVTLVAEARRGWRRAQMPVADIPGEEASFVLLGAHYCTWQDGATDNLAGAALLLELARLFAAGPRPRYGLRFAWWTGHEQGVYAGSSWYADRFRAELYDNAIAYLNVDIVGVRDGTVKALRNTTAELSAYATSVLEQTAGKLSAADDDFVRRALKRLDKTIDPRRSARNSDQSFSGIGLSTAQVSAFLPEAHPDRMPGTGLARWWQTDEDTIDKCDPAILAQDTLIYRNLLEGLVHAASLPFDYRTTADDILSSLGEYIEAAPDNDDLARLLPLAKRLRVAIDALTAHADGSARHNARLLRLARLLNPAQYHAESDFDYDRGRGSRLLPGLAPALTLARMDSDHAHMARVELRRRANRIAHAFAHALELIEGKDF